MGTVPGVTGARHGCLHGELGSGDGRWSVRFHELFGEKPDECVVSFFRVADVAAVRCTSDKVQLAARQAGVDPLSRPCKGYGRVAVSMEHQGRNVHVGEVLTEVRATEGGHAGQGCLLVGLHATPQPDVSWRGKSRPVRAPWAEPDNWISESKIST